MASQLKIDQGAVKVLAELLKETDLAEIEYQIDSLRIKVVRSASQDTIHVQRQINDDANSIGNVVATPVHSETKVSDLENHPGIIEAQMVGTVYLSPGPDANPFISIGDKVTQGQTLFIIEAMKVMNMIKSPRSGIIKHIFVKDGQPVEYGDPIVIVE